MKKIIKEKMKKQQEMKTIIKEMKIGNEEIIGEKGKTKKNNRK